MKNKGRTLFEDLKLINRGIKEFGTFLPKQMRYLVINSAIVSLVPYIGIYMGSCVINELTAGKRVVNLTIYVAVFVMSTLIATIVSSIIQKKITIGYNQLFPAHEIRLNEKANKMPYALLENEKVRELRDQVSGSIDCSGAGMGSLYWDVESISKAICSAIIAIIILCNNFNNIFNTKCEGIYDYANSYMSIILLCALIFISSIVSSKMTSKVFDVMFDVFKHGASYNRYANYYKLEYLSDNKSAKDVRLFAQKDLIVDEVLDKCYTPFCDGDKREKDASTKYNGVKLILSAITGGVVYLLVGFKAISGVIGVGDVLLVYSAVTMLIQAQVDISMTFTDLRNNNEHLIRYFQYIDMEETNSKTEEITPDEKEYNIDFENVSFKYPGSTNYTLKNVSLKIENGKKLAIVGANGSGKTTLIKLLCGLYDVTEGSIKINNHEIKVDTREKITDLYSVVFQDYKLLALSVGKNIAVSDNIDEKKVWSTLERVGLKDKIMTFDKGINQSIYQDYDKDGVSLSGGEEQKLAIARTIYKNASIVILDEPTAALDPVSEFEIYTKLNEISNNKTTIFISHRLYSCKFCDEIVVFENGEIVQRGTHKDLINIEGKYAQMWNAQAQHYKNQ